MNGQPTSDHDSIREWALRHGAVPAQVTPRIFDGEPAILHFLFGNQHAGEPEIEPISWDRFFSLFDLQELVMLFDESPTFQILHSPQVAINPAGSRMA